MYNQCSLVERSSEAEVQVYSIYPVPIEAVFQCLHTICLALNLKGKTDQSQGQNHNMIDLASIDEIAKT
jgi:hypothetical protein